MGITQLLFDNQVRALPGPEYQKFSAEASAAFLRMIWQLSPQSNRMGYRLQGLQGSALLRPAHRELFCTAYCQGGAGVSSGQPIVLMADAQTIGGYPRITCVIEVDLYHLVQIHLGEPIHFVQCLLDEAHLVWQQQSCYLVQLAWRLAQYD